MISPPSLSAQSVDLNPKLPSGTAQKSSVHPVVGLVGVGTIGGLLGALVGGPVGAILGGLAGAIGAAIEDARTSKVGYYATRSQPKPLPTFEQAINSLTTEANEAKKAIAHDLGEIGESVQRVSSELATQVQGGGSTMAQPDNSPDRAIQGILLDVDGTLVSSNDAHAQAWVEAFSAFGHKVAFETIRPLIGMGGDQVVPRMVPELSGEEGVGKQIVDRRKELIIHKFGSTLVPTPGARDLVLKLQQAGFQLVVASSATGEELSVLLGAARVEDLLEESPTTTSGDVKASKPAPDLVQVALEKGQLQPQRAMMLGDTPYDIEAAHQAGVQVIAFRTGGFQDAELTGALAIYDSPADLLAHYDRSALSQQQSGVVRP